MCCRRGKEYVCKMQRSYKSPRPPELCILIVRCRGKVCAKLCDSKNKSCMGTPCPRQLTWHLSMVNQWWVVLHERYETAKQNAAFDR